MFWNNALLLLALLIPTHVLSRTNSSCTTRYGYTSKSSVPTTTKTSTVTTTLTESFVLVTKTITTGTTTVPTSNGFTPVLSGITATPSGPPGGPDAAVVMTAQHPPPPHASYPASVSCSTTTTITITKTVTRGHAATTVTSTTTTTVPAATFYAACAANNIVDQGQGAGMGHAIEFETFGSGKNYTTTEIVNSTAYDCCVACQTTFPCAFSSLATYYNFSPPIQPNCFLMFNNPETCDGATSPGPAEYYFDPGNPGAGPGQGFIISNGPCGQIEYGGAF